MNLIKELIQKIKFDIFSNTYFVACIFILIFVICMNISVAWSQPKSSITCKPLPIAAGIIEGIHKERIVFRGVSERGHVTIIHLNKTTGTWSANVIMPKDINSLCMVDAGTTGEVTDTTFSNKNDSK
jgi:hypothetical protein|tara:strand:- start:319 stop:699 length:381 start_codon:yes stop_codon:yes gene_type:complete